MQVTWQKDIDMAYLCLRDGGAPGKVVRTVVCTDEDIPGLVNLDIDASGRILGIEFAFASRLLPEEVLAQAELLAS